MQVLGIFSSEKEKNVNIQNGTRLSNLGDDSIHKKHAYTGKNAG